MRLTTRTNLAMRTLMFCAANPDRIVRKREIALACNASENHLAQVIHLLAQTGYLRTLRGRTGGLMLGCSAATITVGAVFRQFEACLPFAECFSSTDCTCPLVGACRLKATLATALEGFYAGLDAVTLEDLMRDNTGLLRLLSLG
ncbi:RrF2 family transcriptional regulator [Pseudotabrizicola formosa]|uniref:RrF2 family transcriptional regulator n=1 Tax=Pseudotabrizicola formosa TaxID=2030009 RepID=UPI000CD1282C|nr:Rrf2 family transcriptional regulator [Pseudotabrizicola formosa]